MKFTSAKLSHSNECKEKRAGVINTKKTLMRRDQLQVITLHHLYPGREVPDADHSTSSSDVITQISYLCRSTLETIESNNIIYKIMQGDELLNISSNNHSYHAMFHLPKHHSEPSPNLSSKDTSTATPFITNPYSKLY